MFLLANPQVLRRAGTPTDGLVRKPNSVPIATGDMASGTNIAVLATLANRFRIFRAAAATTLRTSRLGATIKTKRPVVRTDLQKRSSWNSRA
jgi:hypothetical protein